MVELTSGEKVSPAHQRQVLADLRLAEIRLGYLLNSDKARMKDRITRIDCGA